MNNLRRFTLALIALFAISYGVDAFQDSKPAPKPAESETVYAPEKDALEWANYRLQAQVKKAQADALLAEATTINQQADSKLYSIMRGLKLDEAKYEPKLDNQGRLYFARKPERKPE